jgi:hypothetical protein
MRAIYIVILLLVVINTGTVQAADIEQFFMPGELISGHQELESECTNCHVRLRDTTQKKLCLDCHDHKPVADDILNKQGFHGKDKNARELNCKACHSDHKGRDAQVVWLDKDKFDHQFTDFLLEGRHKLVECDACHLEDKKYREAKKICNDCHSEDDIHKGDLGEQCEDCHATSGWSQAEFDHDKTDFKLKFSHQRVACNACHISEKYKDTSKRCVDCHAIRDVHTNRFGKNCATCHQEKAWDKSIFDHNRDTAYKLEDKHRKPGCNDCHSVDYKVSKKLNKKPRDCYSCHRTDDVHNELNGKKCQDCHVVTGWQDAEFDHNANTDFALNGAHEKLVCEACHAIGAKTKEIDTACYGCHKQDDVHKDEQGTECDQCHNEISWQKEVRFDHDLSSFPLIGQHAALGCETCHTSSVFGDASDTCVDCHGPDDVHKLGLGEGCADCHNPNAWLIWRFDHDDTDFKLRHSHTEVHCHTCHNKPLDRFVSDNWRCIDCHRLDDVHDGNFGGACDRCHNEEGFSTINIQSIRSLGKQETENAGE